MKIRFYCLWFFIAVIGRLIPHPPNVTPFTNLSLFAGARLSLLQSTLIVIGGMFVSDLALHFIYHHPLVGYWSIFTYSGFVLVVLVGHLFSAVRTLKNWIPLVILISTGYWVWTNFGVWVLSGLYVHTWQGLVQCYIAALPFLRNAILGDLGWFVIIYLSYRTIKINPMVTLFAHKPHAYQQQP